MTDILDTIDSSLEEVEELLLSEFARIRNSASTAERNAIDVGVKDALSGLVEDLAAELQNSGDRANLQLVTDRHEVLNARIAVLRHLLAAEISTFFLKEAHDGIDTRRKALEGRVIAQRQAEDRHPADHPPAGRPAGDSKSPHQQPTGQETGRNRINVTPEEEEALQDATEYLDNGIFSASRELAMLASLERGGTLDQPPEGQVHWGRAVFEARELSTRVPVVEPKKPAKPLKSPEIARTPEEIRRKIEAGRKQTSSGKAVFTARDIEPAAPPVAPPKKGKPVQKDDKPRTGPATFESRDLSDIPFPKKD